MVSNYSVPSNEVSARDKGTEMENAKRRLKMFYLSSRKITSQFENGSVETTLFIDLKSFKHIS